jgi:hypothetical protein
MSSYTSVHDVRKIIILPVRKLDTDGREVFTREVRFITESASGLEKGSKVVITAFGGSGAELDMTEVENAPAADALEREAREAVRETVE